MSKIETPDIGERTRKALYPGFNQKYSLKLQIERMATRMSWSEMILNLGAALLIFAKVYDRVKAEEAR